MSETQAERLFREAGLSADHDRIIQQGFTHHLFATSVRSGLLAVLEHALAKQMSMTEAQNFRTQMRYMKTSSRVDKNSPYAQAVQNIDGWIDQILREADSRGLNNSIKATEDWIDDSLDRLLRTARSNILGR